MALRATPNRVLGGPQELSRWEKPPRDYMKANWDASVDRDQKRVGIGVVVRNHEGIVVAALSDSRTATIMLEGAESMAAWHAVEFCISRGMRRVVVEGDAITVVRSLQRDEWRGGRFGHVMDDMI